MFTLNSEGKTIDVKLPPLGAVCVQVRYPTDQEWCERTRKLRLVQTPIGRGRSTTEAVNAVECNAELYRRIALNGHSGIDAAEAAYVIDRLERCEIAAIEREGGGFAVTLRCVGARTVHRLKAPTLKQVQDYRRASVPVPQRNRNVIEYRTRLEPAGQLYAELAETAEGYESRNIPIIHKEAVVEAVINEIDRLMDDEDEDPEA